MPQIAMAVVLLQGKVLVQNRFRRTTGMVYEFSGGSVDAGETPEQGAIRELYEETGLRLTQILNTTSFLSSTNEPLHFVLLAGDPNQQPKATVSARKQTFYWFAPEEIPLNDFHDADKEYITKVLPGLIKATES